MAQSFKVRALNLRLQGYIRGTHLTGAAGCCITAVRLTSQVSRKGSLSLKATSWPGTRPQPAGTAGLRLSVGSDAASFVPGTPAQARA